MEKIRILWTGGWDSTYRMVELSKMEVEVQPFYVLDPNRKSVKYELESIKKITEKLRNHKNTKAVIADLKIIELASLTPDKDISTSYKIIHQTTKLGSQHEWLAWLGKSQPGMEMGTEAGTPNTSHIIDALQRYCDLKFDEKGIGYIDPQTSTKEGMDVLGWFKFPIIKLYEKDMLKNIHDWGYEDVMKDIWFCHSPIEGEPCGVCHPCCVKMESDMQFLIPPKAQRRYAAKKKLQRLVGEHRAIQITSKIIQ